MPVLLVIAEAQKPGATRNKGVLQFWEDQQGRKCAAAYVLEKLFVRIPECKSRRHVRILTYKNGR